MFGRYRGERGRYGGEGGRYGGERGERGRHVFYWPLAMPFLAIGLVAIALLVALIQVGVFSYAFARLGISPGAALMILVASLAGSAVNLPVARLRNQVMTVNRTVSVFGVRYIVPVLTRRSTIIAVNVGGALLPVIVSGYLIAHDRIGWQALAAVVIVGALVHAVARPVPGLGIAVPALLPGLFAADLVNLPKVRRLGAPVVSIGGAGTFDGVFLTGIVAVLLAGLL